MNINRHNYEAFFIDYYDGNLSPVRKRSLEMFLSENPDLRKEFEQFESISVPLQKIKFTEKDQLKKKEIAAVSGISEENYEEYFIAFYEEDLNDKEQKSLHVFLDTNPALQKEFTLHGSLTLEPADTKYNEKNKLKKKAAISYYRYAGLAAAVLLIFLVLNYLTKQYVSVRQYENVEIAHMNPQDYSGVVAPYLRGNLIEVPFQEIQVTTPEPDSVEKEWISVLALADIKSVVTDPELKCNLMLNDPVNTVVAGRHEMQQPKQRSLLAQVFRKNLSKVKDELGLVPDSGKKNKKGKNKKEPGFVRFLDRSLLVFNTVTGSETELVKNYDRNGYLRNYRLEGQSILVARKVPSGRSTE